MVSSSVNRLVAAFCLLFVTAGFGFGQQSGSISGTVTDADFGTPLPGVRVTIVDTRQVAETGPQGGYSFLGLEPGGYTLVFSKSGFDRTTAIDQAVVAGDVTDVDAALEGRLIELDDLFVEKTELLGGATELGLLNLRLEAPSLTDSIGADLLRKAGVGDVAEGLKRIPGATVADDATPVVRGLPDRYVPSLVNNVRLPSANEDKRAVELDQFPTAIVESISVAKTFTPDNQGDGSGGIVNVQLKSVPDEPVLNFSGSYGYNTQAANESGFLGYRGGGVGGLGLEAGSRGPQLDNIGGNWDGAVGVSPTDAPIDYKMGASIGDSYEFDNGVKVGGFMSLFYERDSSYYDNGRNDSYWLNSVSEGLIPQVRGPGSVAAGEFQTALFDVRRGSQFVQWGGSASAGVEFENNKFGLQYLYSHTAEDVAVLAEDTRGKLFYFPDYDVNDPADPGNLEGQVGGASSAPYLRNHTLEYTERTTGTLQLRGEHQIQSDPFTLGAFEFDQPEVDWTLSSSFADLDQPDKRLFGATWAADRLDPGTSATPPTIIGQGFGPNRPGENINLGFLQRIFKTIEEDSKQGSLNVKLPFRQWDDDEGYFKLGLFQDSVDRAFVQDNFSNSGDNGSFSGNFFTDYWTDNWENENHPIQDVLTDIDYDGEIDIQAWYSMMDLPLSESVKLVGGARFESTDIAVRLSPEDQATWVPPGGTAIADLQGNEADVGFSDDSVLPAASLVWEASPAITVRGAWSRTIARQTFKELVAVFQQEFLGAPIFIGNPDLSIARLKNYDLRVDYKPSDDTFLSASYFFKDVEDPIENIQRVVSFGFTTPVNYPEGQLSGFELEARQELGGFAELLEGFAVGANATFIDSEVTFPQAQLDEFAAANLPFFGSTRDATNAPESLYNLYATYDIADTQTQFALFYTVQGDTLVAGDSTSQFNYIPAIYQKSFGTLNASISQRLMKNVTLRLAASNLTNPSIDQVYRSPLIEGDTTFTSFTRGVEYSLGISANFSF